MSGESGKEVKEVEEERRSSSNSSEEEEDDGELASSKLGTMKHWDSVYEQELTNFKSFKDEGEIWFGEDCLMRMIRWFTKNVDKIPLDSPILDLGCGNGITSIQLRKEGFQNITGCDYSQAAIDLAIKVAQQYGEESILFKTCDILTSPLSSLSFRACVDKGTYDAISLNPDDPKSKRDLYIQNVYGMLEENGYLVLTSCNWTEAELLTQFESHFQKIHLIPSPQFQFGGKVGNMVTSIVFQKTLK